MSLFIIYYCEKSEEFTSFANSSSPSSDISLSKALLILSIIKSMVCVSWVDILSDILIEPELKPAFVVN